jgi:hypothetical protein
LIGSGGGTLPGFTGGDADAAAGSDGVGVTVPVVTGSDFTSGLGLAAIAGFGSPATAG